MAILDLQRRSLLDWSAIFGQNLKKSIFFHSHPQYSTSPTGVLKSKEFFSKSVFRYNTPVSVPQWAFQSHRGEYSFVFKDDYSLGWEKLYVNVTGVDNFF